MAEQQTTPEAGPPSTSSFDLTIRPPQMPDGGPMWRVARDSGSLDLNTSYAYLLLARDFAATSRVAVVAGEVVGFVLGYRRPDAPDCLFIWQIAVDDRVRGHGIAARLLDELLDSLSDVRYLETTITEDNAASQRLFAALAERRSAPHEVQPLFEASHFPDGHDGEPVHIIGPLSRTS